VVKALAQKQVLYFFRFYLDSVIIVNAVCYILFSEKLNKFYVGATQDEIESRLQKHNNQSYGAHRFTAGTNDWGIFLILEAVDFPHAVRMERKIKAMKSRTYFLNLKKYPELQEKLKNTTGI
jgi:putative endonuclease